MPLSNNKTSNITNCVKPILFIFLDNVKYISSNLISYFSKSTNIFIIIIIKK